MSGAQHQEPERTVILGVGNVLLGDEGVGVHVVREIEKRKLPEGVRAIDGGTGGFNLIDIIAEADRLIVVDTLTTDAEPGAVFKFSPEEVGRKTRETGVSMHDIGLLEALAVARASGYEPVTTIFGVVPARIDWGMDLSPQVAAVVPKVIELVLHEVPGL